MHLGWSENKTRRIRSLAGVVIRTASKKRRYGKAKLPEVVAPPNALHGYAVFKNEARPQDGMDYSGMVESGGWVQDFTYLWFDRSHQYLAVVLDLKTRQVVGWRLGTNHSSELTYSALLDALSKHYPPAILHSDQGSEYLSYKHQLLCERMEITLSCSAKSSPWQNGFVESFHGRFRDECLNRELLWTLTEARVVIEDYRRHYNQLRPHSKLGYQSPAHFAARSPSPAPVGLRPPYAGDGQKDNINL